MLAIKTLSFQVTWIWRNLSFVKRLHFAEYKCFVIVIFYGYLSSIFQISFMYILTFIFKLWKYSCIRKLVSTTGNFIHQMSDFHHSHPKMREIYIWGRNLLISNTCVFFCSFFFFVICVWKGEVSFKSDEHTAFLFMIKGAT